MKEEKLGQKIWWAENVQYIVIIMSVFYPLESLGNGTKNGWLSDYTRPKVGIYPILQGKK